MSLFSIIIFSLAALVGSTLPSNMQSSLNTIIIVAAIAAAAEVLK